MIVDLPGAAIDRWLLRGGRLEQQGHAGKGVQRLAFGGVELWVAPGPRLGLRTPLGEQII